NEFSERPGADDGESSPDPSLRISRSNTYWLYFVARWSSSCRRVTTGRTSLRFLFDLYGSRTLSGGVYSHQPAFLFRFDQCAGSEYRIDSGGSNPTNGVGGKDSPANSNLK